MVAGVEQKKADGAEDRRKSDCKILLWEKSAD